jgi:hypothetical protein
MRRRQLDDVEDRVYIRVSGCVDCEGLEIVRALLAKRVGKVWDCGLGTEKDPSAGWFEVRPRPRVREKGVVEVLKKLDLMDRVEDCYPISRGYGKVHARQLDLFQVG